MKRLPVLGILLVFCTCELDPRTKIAIAAAGAFTKQYAKQRLIAAAAGQDCLVLLIRANDPLDDTTVEAIHYGTGDYKAYDGGAQQFAEDRKFRAVAYRDTNGGLWTYGAITRAEAQSIPICR